ncbi:MAG: hypothetical protein ABIR70_15625 [Bryobacteraceae bacterium]
MNIAPIRVAWLILAVVLLPSIWIAWTYRAMPQVGAYHDDAIYLETAKSLAETGTYRIPSMPGQPYQTKYPPLLPWLLSIVWYMDPNFPANLPKMTLLCWSLLALYVLQMFQVMQQWGRGPVVAATLAGFAAISPHLILAGTMAMSELAFGALVMTSILFLEHGMDRIKNSLPATVAFALAGISGGLAFLTRTQGVALLVSSLAVLAYRHLWRQTLVFGSIFSLAILGWAVWSRTHAYTGMDPVILYYVDYVRFFLIDIKLTDLPVFAWTNLDSICSAVAGLLFAGPSVTLWERMLAWVVTCGAVSGIVRITRESDRLHFVAYALVSMLMLLPWPWPPNERYLIPILPVIALGFAREIVHLVDMCRVNLRKSIPEKVIATGILLGIASLVISIGLGNVRGATVQLPSILNDFADIATQRQPGYEWIRANTAPDATFLTYDDPLLYLRTNRRGYALPVLHWLSYGGNSNRTAAYFDTTESFMAEHQLDYALITVGDFRRDLTQEGQRKFLAAMGDGLKFERTFSSPGASVFRRVATPGLSATLPGSWWSSVRESIPSIE